MGSKLGQYTEFVMGPKTTSYLIKALLGPQWNSRDRPAAARPARTAPTRGPKRRGDLKTGPGWDPKGF